MEKLRENRNNIECKVEGNANILSLIKVKISFKEINNNIILTRDEKKRISLENSNDLETGNDASY